MNEARCAKCQLAMSTRKTIILVCLFSLVSEDYHSKDFYYITQLPLLRHPQKHGPVGLRGETLAVCTRLTKSVSQALLRILTRLQGTPLS